MGRIDEARDGATRALSDLVGGLLPLASRDLQAEVDEKLAQVPNRLNEFGYDPFAPSQDNAAAIASWRDWLARQ